MTQYDDDLIEMKARLAASRDRQTGRFAQRMAVARSVPPRALAIPGTRDFSLEAVTPGWQVFSIERRLANGEDDMDFAEAAGGVVVEVIHDRVTDYETGEIMPRTRYRTLAMWRPSHPRYLIDAGDVDLSRLAGVDRLGSTTAVRWLLRPVALSDGKVLTSKEIAAIADAHRIAMAVA
jgi:hypothetical protein